MAPSLNKLRPVQFQGPEMLINWQVKENELIPIKTSGNDGRRLELLHCLNATWRYKNQFLCGWSPVNVYVCCFSIMFSICTLCTTILFIWTVFLDSYFPNCMKIQLTVHDSSLFVEDDQSSEYNIDFARTIMFLFLLRPLCKTYEKYLSTENICLTV